MHASEFICQLSGSPFDSSLLFKSQNGHLELTYVVKTHFCHLRACGARGRASAGHTFMWVPRWFQRGIAHPHTPTHSPEPDNTKIFIYSMMPIAGMRRVKAGACETDLIIGRYGPSHCVTERQGSVHF